MVPAIGLSDVRYGASVGRNIFYCAGKSVSRDVSLRDMSSPCPVSPR